MNYNATFTKTSELARYILFYWASIQEDISPGVVGSFIFTMWSLKMRATWM
jgi:hypothetical protein